MKKLLLIPALLISTLGIGQAIDVSSTSHTVPQLVNNVLINSPCVSATNITWQTGTNFDSSNGIGYFTNTNPAFPMASGVVLSTGSAQNAEGPNTTLLNDGTLAWPGDANLEATLAAAGIPMSSVNATILEFDFMPISPNFSFDFIFASEEYGNFQCQFSDAFAFLLTNVNTGVTTNLALVPGTSQPISVVTIRDFLYNSSCGSSNPQYFGSFNGGSQAAGSAINFNGQTVVLNAAAALIPNTPYHIKLVIADRSDNQSDSAIFISSDSFNIGQDVLGLDLTADNNSSLCNGQDYTLATGLNPANYTFSWTKDGVTISGASGPTINVTQPGIYGVTYNNIASTCQPVTDFVTIEYSGQLTTANPITLYKCGTAGNSYAFDLSLNTAIVSAGITPAPVVSYHLTDADANNNANPLPLSYASAGNQTIYVRIKNAGNACYTVKSFQLMVAPPATANQPANLNGCARSLLLNNDFFTLTSQNAAILGGQSSAINSVLFYYTLADAQTNTNPISSPQYVVLASQTIYVRVQNMSDPSCYSITNFDVIVNPMPLVDELESLIVCEPYTLLPLENGNYFSGLNGTGTPMFAGDIIEDTQTIYIFNQPGGPGTCGANSSFQIKVIDPLTLSPSSGTYCTSYPLPELAAGDYFTQAGGLGDILPVGSVITESQTVYVYFEAEEEPFCVIDTHFDVTILPSPDLGTFGDIFDCVSYTLPALAEGKYYTEPFGQGSEIPAGTVITASQSVYVFEQFDSNPVCASNASFNVYIGVTVPPNVSQCVPYTLQHLPIGNYFTGPNATGTMLLEGAVISQSTTLYIFVTSSNPVNCTADIHFDIHIAQPPIDFLENVSVCDSYTLPALANGNYYTGINGTGTLLNAGDVITTNQTIYVFATSSGDCNNESSFTVTLNPLPAIDSRSDIDVCNSYVLTDLTVGNYFTGPGGTGIMLPAGTAITETQLIYIYAISNTTPPCIAENSFTINIFSVEADSPADVVACDSYVLPALTVGDYYLVPGGPTANEGMMNAGDVITLTTTLYIFIESGERINCTDENVFNITINQTPVLAPIADQHTCDTYTLPELIVGNYFTGPGGTGTMMQEDDVLDISQTVYVYAQTGTTPNCSVETSFTLDIFNVDAPPNVLTCESYVLPALTIGRYFTGQGGTGTMFNAGTTISNSMTLYVYAVSPFLPTCSDESAFTVTIIDTPVAHPVAVAMTTVCDQDAANDGVTTFDLTTLSATILGSQLAPEFSIAYYESLADANAGTNAVTSTTATSVFVRVSNALAPNCFDVNPVTIVVNKLPEPAPIGGIICFDTETQTLLNPYTIPSGLGSGHTFQWHDALGQLVGTGNTYTAVLPGTYTVTATRIATGCASQPVSVVVTPSEPALVSYSITEDFADEQSVTVVAVGTGDYEYQLDFGVFQDSAIFENVSSGMHTVTVRDKNGCGIATTSALVVNYPHFFTPNNDGYHDTWNIKDLNDQANSKISIFDRYGKFIQELRPNGAGWDGTYQGQPMPSTDYWFVVVYEEDGMEKEFKAHFAIKR